MSGTFPVWTKKLIDRVNAGGDEGIPEIIDHLPLFQRAGVLTHDPVFLQTLIGIVDLREAQLRPTGKIPSDIRKLRKNEYLVPVSYAPLPSFSELEHEFGKGNVSDIFDGRLFQKHASCCNIDETSGDKIFLVKYFGRETESENNIAEMDKRGYRPATHIEAHAFQKVKPKLQRQFRIVALGSFAMGGGRQCVAVLDGGSDGRIFGGCWFGSRWGAGRRFLFVRK